jgi:hypothetical protein
MRCRIRRQFTQRAGTAGATLIKNDEAPMRGVKKPPMDRARAGTGAAMQKQHRLTARITDLFPIHHMPT